MGRRVGRVWWWLPVVAGIVPPLRGAAQQVSQAALVWPAPPEPARIRYVGALSTERDVGKKESLARRVRRALVGAAPEGVLRVQRPFDVYAVSEHRIYVSDGLTQALLLFDRQRKEARLVGLDVPGGLQKPMGIGAGGGGSVLVADQAAKRVVVLGPEGQYLRSFGDQTVLLNPVDAAADTVAGRYYVVDSYLHQVVVFDGAGQVVQRLGRTAGDAASKLRPAPDTVRLSGDQSSGAAPPHALSAGLSRAPTRDVLENRGDGPGEFKYPWAVAVGRDGTVYVSDQMNFRVQAFDRTGAFVRHIGALGTTPGSLARPKGVAVDSDGHLYVVDAAFNNVQVFDAEGSLLLAFGTGGSGPGGQILPLGLAIDGQDRIYLADRFNNRIQIYQYLGGQ